jgi:aromatic-L-amino-acid decarboxylase
VSDLSPDELRRMGGAAVERLARYFETLESRPVLARTAPGEVLRQLPQHAPEIGEGWDAIERDLDTLVEPHLTHWQHPGYFAYFANTGAVPGVVGDILAAGYNQIGILWRTSPVLTELEQAVVRWLVDLVGLPTDFDGQLADTASSASLIALAAAREQAFPEIRKTGWGGLPAGVVYSSELAHSSIDKACVVLGLGTDGLRKIPVDERFAMRVDALAAAIAEDRAKGRRPVAVVATVGTTSVASADPVAAIAEISERETIWLHVDAAYAGSAAAVPETRRLFAGWERGDSVVFNPHKWMFVPLECTALLFRRMERVRKAFSVVPHYLETPEGSAGVREYMDYGIQLGRRFRALKMWFTLRLFGAEGVRARIREHLAMAQELAKTLAKEPDVEVLAPVLFSLVVFRFAPEGLSPAETDAANRRILEAINAEGTSFISHAVLAGRYVLRLAIGNIRTERRHLEAFLASFRRAAERERAETLGAKPA